MESPALNFYFMTSIEYYIIGFCKFLVKWLNIICKEGFLIEVIYCVMLILYSLNKNDFDYYLVNRFTYFNLSQSNFDNKADILNVFNKINSLLPCFFISIKKEGECYILCRERERFI